MQWSSQLTVEDRIQDFHYACAQRYGNFDALTHTLTSIFFSLSRISYGRADRWGTGVKYSKPHQRVKLQLTPILLCTVEYDICNHIYT